MHELGVGGERVGRRAARGAARSRRSASSRALGAEEARRAARAGRAPTRVPRQKRAPAPRRRAGTRRRTALAWRCSSALWRARQRHADVGADVGDHAPDHRVGDLVEPGEAEQLQRLEQLDAERALLEQADRQPARARERRQQQRVEPDREAGGEAGSAPARVPPFQKMPPSIAGANCATAANEIRPIDTSA